MNKQNQIIEKIQSKIKINGDIITTFIILQTCVIISVLVMVFAVNTISQIPSDGVILVSMFSLFEPTNIESPTSEDIKILYYSIAYSIISIEFLTIHFIVTHWE